MSRDDSRTIIDSLKGNIGDNPQIERILRAYFIENSDTIWPDALYTHELI